MLIRVNQIASFPSFFIPLLHLPVSLSLLPRLRSCLYVYGCLQVDSARGKALGDEYHMRFWETSAKDGTNVREAFYTIARDIVGRMLAGDAPVDGAGAAGAAGAAGGAAGAAGAAGKGGKGGKDEKCTVM